VNVENQVSAYAATMALLQICYNALVNRSSRHPRTGTETEHNKE